MTEKNMTNGIIANATGLCFGDYNATEKIKVNDFEHMGSTYSLRTHNQVTRLEKNGELLLETVPGARVLDFCFSEKGCSFEIESNANVQVTLGMLPEAAYDLAIAECNIKGAETHEEIEANRSGKISFGVELVGAAKKVVLERL